MPIPNKPVVLVILDGWGIAPPSRGNPISIARTPMFDSLIDSFPTMALQASGEAVGLPWGEMGNSEVGHLNMGAGRIVYQNLPRISKAISDGSFFTNQAFLGAAEHIKKHKSRVHLVGLVSTGGVHSSLDHLFALLTFCQQQKIRDIYIHAILDGRDTPPQSGVNFITKLQDKIKELKVGAIATISGRYYAMDRDNRWDREEKAYNAMTAGVAARTGSDPISILEKSYKEGNYDEEFFPAVITAKNKPVAVIKDYDAVVFFNFRPDRARQLTTAFVLPGFEKFRRPAYLKDLFFVTMTEYDKDLPVVVAFPPENIAVPVGKVLSDAGLRQLHIAETEKYAHVTYFFNGGREEPFSGQDNILVPSPSVATYDQKPAMSAFELTDRLVKEINKGKHDFIVVNYANVDMVGHTGNVQATVEGVEAVDQCLNKLIKTVLPLNGLLFITADHGNGEELLNLQTAAMDKEHSVNPVPFIAIGENWRGQTLYKDMIVEHDLSMLQPTGILSDITVTVLEYMGLQAPSEMTGHNLLL
jgi:2,3-bisphosphoglycerate-independent phosphoglycerate mutase